MAGKLYMKVWWCESFWLVTNDYAFDSFCHHQHIHNFQRLSNTMLFSSEIGDMTTQVCCRYVIRLWFGLGVTLSPLVHSIFPQIHVPRVTPSIAPCYAWENFSVQTKMKCLLTSGISFLFSPGIGPLLCRIFFMSECKAHVTFGMETRKYRHYCMSISIRKKRQWRCQILQVDQLKNLPNIIKSIIHRYLKDFLTREHEQSVPVDEQDILVGRNSISEVELKSKTTSSHNYFLSLSAKDCLLWSCAVPKNIDQVRGILGSKMWINGNLTSVNVLVDRWLYDCECMNIG